VIARFTTWLGDRPRGELAAHAALVVLALVLRLIALGDRPFHHDESQDAYFSWTLADKGDYHYQPILHGPLRFYLTAAVYTLFGDSDFTARLAPALMGTLVVALPYLLRRQIGSIAAFAAAVGLAIGPTYLYFSRFAREDIYFAAITFGLLVAVARYLDRPRRGGPIIIGALLALSFATKESTFITGFVAVTFLLPMAAWQSWREVSDGGDWRDGEIVAAVREVGYAPWAYGLATFAMVFALLFTVFFTRPDGLWDGIYEGLHYWLGQQDVGRGGEPWYFYLAVLVGEEWPVLLLAAVGIAWSVRHPTTVRLFLIWMFALSLAVYSWASERFAWLAMHPLLPLLLLAGMGVQAIWLERRRALRIGGLVVVALGLAYAGYASFLVNAKHPVDPREFLVSTQSSQDVKDVAQRVLRLDREVTARTGERLTVNVDSGQGATFPYAWYFRHLPIGYIDMSTPGYEPSSQVLIMTEPGRAKLLPLLAAWEGRKYRFRVWWVRDWDQKLHPGAWWRWFTERKTWNPTGGLPEWIYVRRDLVD
jgi:uncharacterized protein (TIGR03663 family)